MTNHLLNNSTREQVYSFFFQMFQSYSFKQFLTISLATNYKAVMENKQTHYHHEISSIPV